MARTQLVAKQIIWRTPPPSYATPPILLPMTRRSMARIKRIRRARAVSTVENTAVFFIGLVQQVMIHKVVALVLYRCSLGSNSIACGMATTIALPIGMMVIPGNVHL